MYNRIKNAFFLIVFFTFIFLISKHYFSEQNIVFTNQSRSFYEISLTKLEPHRITFYLYDLATLFHSYWNLGSKNKDFRFISENKSIKNSRLILLLALSIVIKNGMSILGVSTPKSM